MTDSLRGRVGIVTGAGRGIGRAIATDLAAEGMSLVLISRTGAQVRQLADELIEQFGTRCLPAAIDVTDHAAIDRVMMHAEQQLGAIDLLVNSAGVVEEAATPLWLTDPGETWRVVETNLRGPMLMTRAVLPAMIARGRGHIVNLGSRTRAATLTGAYTGYAVSKRALTALTESLAPALQGTGVVVVDVLPGLVRTGLTTSMPLWDNVTEWNSASETARVVADVARGLYDDRSGEVIDAIQR
ncbi:MAG: SDR family oxidoreductase [Nocardiaceae bacterium]|nr:SDR family oxidoreductase [Nocardiaceae bacterium]